MITWMDTLNPADLNKLFGILFRYSTDNIREDILYQSMHIHIYICLYACE